MAANENEVGRYIIRVMGSLKPIETFAWYFYLGLAALIGLFSLAIGVQVTVAKQLAEGFQAFLLTGGVSLVVVTAATSVGCLLGFLFGIPRSLQGSAPTAGADAGAAEPRSSASVARAFMSNTSLEEISDWLTKIIIGLGLVQFQLFIEYLYLSALYASSFVAMKSIPAGDITALEYDPGLASPFYFGLIVTSLIVGCLFAYLETRTRLMLLFIDAEGANKQHGRDRELAQKASEVPVTVPQGQSQPTAIEKGRRPATIRLAPTAEDVAVTQVPLDSLKNPKEVMGWAAAQARTGNYGEAEQALLNLLRDNPSDNDIRERIVEVRRLRGDSAGALAMKLEIAERTTDKAKQIQLLRGALYEALYVPPPDGFVQAVAISSKLMEVPGTQTDSTIFLWRAAALGQQFSWMLDNQKTAEELKAVWEDALKAVQKVVELNPNYEATDRALLRSMYEGGLPDENDLEVFRKHPDHQAFDDVIYRDRPL